MERKRIIRTGKARKPKSFDLFSLFTFLLPGPWGALLLTGGLMLLQVTFALVYAGLFGAGLIGRDAMLLLTYATSFAVLLIPCASISRANAFRQGGGIALNSGHFGKPGALAFIPIGIAGMIGAAFALEPLSSLLEWMFPPSEAFREVLSGMAEGNIWLISLQVCLLAPVMEELLCRGLILRGLLQRMRPGWAIILSAFLFALMHGNLWQGVPAMLLGALLGFVYYKTGSLLLTMLMHAANNAFSLMLIKTPSYAAASDWTDILPLWGYVALVVAGALLAALLVWMLVRIPREHPRGNLDPVGIDDLVGQKANES